jgi:hypothetical protein
MWKVKRMNTARIVVLTIAVGAGGVAAHRAGGSDDKPGATDPVAQRHALRSTRQGPTRGASFDVARSGVSSLTTTEKRPGGLTT